jgi:hypothetical protein
MAAYAPGMIPYTATFFIFTDYMRAAIRVAALSELRHIFVMTHDSIGLGEACCSCILVYFGVFVLALCVLARLLVPLCSCNVVCASLLRVPGLLWLRL